MFVESKVHQDKLFFMFHILWDKECLTIPF